MLAEVALIGVATQLTAPGVNVPLHEELQSTDVTDPEEVDEALRPNFVGLQFRVIDWFRTSGPFSS